MPTRPPLSEYCRMGSHPQCTMGNKKRRGAGATSKYPFQCHCSCHGNTRAD